MVWWCHCQYYPSLLFCLCVFCFSPPNRVPMLVILRVMGAVGSRVTTMGWVMTMEEVAVMGPLGRGSPRGSPVLVAVVEPCVQQDEGEVDGVCGDADGGG